MAMQLNTSLTRNTVYRKNIMDTVTDGQPVVDGQGYTQYPVPSTKVYTETKEED